jgi:hypothetical protein
MAHLAPELLSAYIDHELPAADMAAVEEHLAVCDACRAEYEELRGLSTLVRELPVYRPKREIDVSDYPRGGPDMLAKVIAFSKPLAIAAVVLLVALAGLRLLTDDEPDDAGDQISFSAVQPTASGTEPGGAASEDQAANASAAARSDSEAPAAAPSDGEAPPAQATLPPALGAMPARVVETQPAPVLITAEPPSSVAPEPTAAPVPVANDGGGDSWLPEAIVAIVVVALAGAAGWYRFVRPPARRRR